MLIAQISDTHIALDTADTAQRISDFERTIADINALNPLPDVIIHTGDIVHNGRAEEYACAADILVRAKPPVFVILGNKDRRDALHSAFAGGGYLPDDPQFITYVVENFPVRLIAADTLDPDSNKGGFCAERAHRLSALLAADTSKPAAVFAHHPPFKVNAGPEPWNFSTPADMERFRNALIKAPQVATVFCGHVHRPDFGAVGDIPVMVMPSVSTSVRWGEYPEAMRSSPVYYLHRYESGAGFATCSRVVRG